MHNGYPCINAKPKNMKSKTKAKKPKAKNRKKTYAY